MLCMHLAENEKSTSHMYTMKVGTWRAVVERLAEMRTENIEPLLEALDRF